jgi:hypothetical protein
MTVRTKRGFIFVSALALFLSPLATGARARQQAGPHAPRHGDGQAAPCDCPCAAREGGRESGKPGDPARGHGGHLDEALARGERAMGFSQARTTHHFLLLRDGGVILVGADDPRDAESLGRVRRHLAHIARAFAEGDFDTPAAVHGRVPPGVPEMKRLKASIKYEYAETERGGRVRITTGDREALAAVHAFLRFQIEDHRTGDPAEVIN